MKPEVCIPEALVTPVRQRTQYTCVPCSLMMCLNALGMDLTEDEVNDVMGARPMQGASWEQVIAATQHFGKRATLTAPCTIEQLKEWTSQGLPVMIAYNPEGRDWSHASVLYSVSNDLSQVTIADPNMPDPKETVRIMSTHEFYKVWFEKFPNYLVRRPACVISPEISERGLQVRPPFLRMASRIADRYLSAQKKNPIEDAIDILKRESRRMYRPSVEKTRSGDVLFSYEIQGMDYDDYADRYHDSGDYDDDDYGYDAYDYAGDAYADAMSSYVEKGKKWIEKTLQGFQLKIGWEYDNYGGIQYTIKILGGRVAQRHLTAGRTHFWEMTRDFSDREWSKILRQAKDILTLGNGEFWVSGENGKGLPALKKDYILFNGSLGDTGEDFYLSKTKRDFSYCKTFGNEYDEAVIEVLKAAKTIAPDAIDLKLAR